MFKKLIIPAALLLSSCSHTTKFVDSLKKGQEQIREKKGHQIVWANNGDPASYQTGNLPISKNSPYLYRGLLVMGDQNGVIGAYDVRNGSPVWMSNDPHAFYGQAAVYDDMLFYGIETGRLIVRNIYSGIKKYSIDLGLSIETRPVFHKGMLFVLLKDHTLLSLDAETGKILWKYKRSVTGTTSLDRMATPLVSHGKIFLGHADGHLTAHQIQDGHLLWEKKLSQATKFLDVDNQPLVVGHSLMVSPYNGPIHRLDMNTGKVLQKYDVFAMRTPLRLGEKFFAGTESGELIVFDLYGKILEKKKVSKGSLLAMTLWKDELIVGSSVGEVFFFDAQTLNQNDLFHSGHRYSTLLGEFDQDEDFLSFYSSRNRLYVFKR